MFEQSNYYTRFPDEVEDRLDFVYYHPEMDSIKAFRSSDATFPFSELVSSDGVDYGVTKSGKEKGDKLFVNTQNIGENGLINKENIKYVDEVPEKKLLRKGEVLISRSRLLGRMAVVTDEFEGATFGSYIIRFKLKEGCGYLPEFLTRHNYSTYGQKQVELLKTGSAGANINSGQLLDIHFIRIDEKSQHEVLSEIYPLEKEAADLELKAIEMKTKADQILFHGLGINLSEEPGTQFFVQDVDGINDKLSYGAYHPATQRLRDSLESASFAPKPLGELINLHKEFIDSAKTPDEQFVYIGLENVEPHTGKLKGVQTKRGGGVFSKSGVFKKGQLLFSGLRPYLNKAFILKDYETAIGSAQFFVCEAKEGVSLEFLKYYLLSEATLRQTKWILSGSSYPRLDETEFLKLRVVIPSELEEQEQIARSSEAQYKEVEKAKLQSRQKIESAKKKFGELIEKVTQSPHSAH